MSNMTEEFEPRIIAFLYNWCSYRGADLAGTSRFHYPPNVRAIRVMCSVSIDPVDTNEKARLFMFEEEPMFSKRESELLQQYIAVHGEMPEGNRELDDLF